MKDLIINVVLLVAVVFLICASIGCKTQEAVRGAHLLNTFPKDYQINDEGERRYYDYAKQKRTY